ncbi:MAG: aldo/keto reductase [Rhodothermia bacterium]|nr:aldo/keto reductase [Rhodothermia bacterium]
MRTRQLGFTDLHLTTIGLGTWAIGGPWDFGWGPQDDELSVATIHRALDLGINWIDTAPAYGLGHSEEIVGKVVAGRREDVYVATKCGLVWDKPSDRKVKGRLRAESVRKEAEDSLRRLQVDVIDLYQIHWPNPDEDIEEAWEEIARLVDEGKVRYAGVSNFSVSQLRRVSEIHPVASLQPPYSMLVRGVENELLDYCLQNEIGVVAYSPMQAGLLTGKFTRERLNALPPDDWRRKNEQFREPRFSANLKLAEKLEVVADRCGRTLAEFAIAWVLRRPEVTSAIVGARRPDQIEGTFQAADWELTSAEIDEIEELLARYEAGAFA